MDSLNSELNDSEKEILRFLGSSKTKETFWLKELIHATSKRKVEYNVTGTKKKRNKNIVEMGFVGISPHEHGKARKVWLTDKGRTYLEQHEPFWTFQEKLDKRFPKDMPNEERFRAFLYLHEEVLTRLLDACWNVDPENVLELYNLTLRIYDRFFKAKYATEKSVSDMLHNSLDKMRASG